MRIPSVQIFVGGVEIETAGNPKLTIPPDTSANLADFNWPEPGDFSFTAKIEPAMPADIEKLRSVSPAAKKVFARDRMKRSIEAWLLKAAGVANENR